MCQWSDLPSEVLQVTFRHLKCRSPYISDKTDDLLECELVCRNWRLPAQIVLYADIYLHTEEQVVKFINLVANPDQRAIGTYVKGIYLNNSDHPRINYMESLSRHCPFVETIDSSELDNTFYLRLIQIQKESRWTYLKRVPVPYNDGEYLDSYAACVITYKDSLEHINLTDTVEDECNQHNQVFPVPFKKLYDNLDQFSCLNTISIIDHHSNKSLEEFDDVFEKCAFLKAIYLELHPPISTARNSIVLMDRRLWFDLDRIAPDPYIKTFVGDGAILYTDNSLLYIMHKFSDLQKITLNQNERVYRYSQTIPEKMNRAKHNFSASIVGQFLTYLRQVPLYHLGLFDCVANMTSVIEHHLSLLPPTDELLPLEIKNEEATTTDEEVEINMTNIQRYRKHGGDMIITFHNKGDNLPSLELIQRCGDRMRDLTFQLHTITLKRFTVGGDAYKMATGYILDHIFRYCTNLTHLTLHNLRLIQCNYDNISINTSINHLTISSALIPNTNLFVEISARLPSLKFITLRLCTIGTHTKYGLLFDNNKLKKKTQCITDTLFSFDMVNTAFDTFYIQQGIMTLPQYNFTRLCLEIQQSTLPQQYYMVSTNTNNTETDTSIIEMGKYGASIGDASCANICIRCKSIAKVKIDWRPIDCEIIL